ncbi:MAG: sugar ABC transporter permease [Lachnospiraceae bacterium]|nr:sugar ABC transporter permease [Lachnospiraceae bacterium]
MKNQNVTAEEVKSRKKRKKGKYDGLMRHRAIAGYMFILPFILGFLLLMVKPLIHSLYMSFCNVTLEPGSVSYSWIGTENIRYIFRVDADYTRMLTEDFTKMVIYTFAIIVFSFFVSLILNQEFKGRALVRAIFFMPVILSSGVMLNLESNNQYMSIIQDTIEETTTGVSVTAALESILRTAGVGVRAYETVFEIIDNIYDIAMASGIQIIIFLSGLQTISSSLYEAASIDGCTKWESLWKVTFPMVSSLFLVNWIYTVVDFCMRSDTQVMTKIQTEMVDKQSYGVASAMSWAYFLVVIAFIGLTSFFISKVVYYSDER